jgi:hypothetical protein
MVAGASFIGVSRQRAMVQCIGAGAIYSARAAVDAGAKVDVEQSALRCTTYGSQRFGAVARHRVVNREPAKNPAAREARAANGPGIDHDADRRHA